MFLLGLRDRTGLSVAAKLFVAWIFSMLLMQSATTAVSLMILLWSVFVTIYAAWVLLKSRNSLRFHSRSAQEIAFPSSPMNERLIFWLLMLIVLIFFFPGATMLIMKSPDLTEAENRMVAGMAFLVGNFGVAGLALQGLRKLYPGA